jgi:hypothetical protein
MKTMGTKLLAKKGGLHYLDKIVVDKILKKNEVNSSNDEFQSFDYDGDNDNQIKTPNKTTKTRFIEGPSAANMK